MTRILVCFLITFATASAWALVDHVDLPEGCFARKFPCAVTFLSTGKVKLGEVQVSVKKGTAVLLRKEEFELLNGEVWSDEFEATRLRHGLISAAMTGDILVQKEGDQITFISLNGVVEVNGVRKTVEPIPSGFQNWYRGLGQRGEFVQGVIEPFRPDDFLRSWADLAGLTLNEAKERVEIYATNRKQAVGEASDLYRDILQLRRLASDERERQVQAAHVRREQEKAHFRKMMQDRLYRPD